MQHYHVWCNLKESRRDLEFASAVHAYLGHLKALGSLLGFTLTRRTLGFGPPELAEFHIEMTFSDLAQLDSAFGIVAARAGEVERLHAAVFSAVTDFRSALYRDFPDPQRLMAATPGA